MTTITRAASSNTIVTTGWTSATNAYASDNVYATASPAAGASIITDYGFANFLVGDIPDSSAINSVTVGAEWYVGTASAATLGLLLRNNAVQVGNEVTYTGTTETTSTTTVYSGVTLTDLRSASTLLKARVRDTRTALATSYLDYVFMTVDYDAPSADLSSVVFGTGLGAISPTFAAATTSYTVSLRNSTSEHTLTAVALAANSTLQYRVNGSAYSTAVTGQLSTTLTLNIGSNTVDILVTSATAVTKTYSFTVIRSGRQDFQSDISINGLDPFGTNQQETVGSINATSGTIAYSYATGATVFYHVAVPTADWTVNFTGIPTTNNRSTTIVLIVPQSSAGNKPAAVQIDGTAQTVRWASSYSNPPGSLGVNATKIDMWTFTLLRIADRWIVFGIQGANFGA